MDTFFIQYYDKDPWFIINDIPIPKWSFSNGFSQTYKHLKNLGDFIWLQSGSPIPIDKGNIFISLQYKEDGLDKIIEKAKSNPDINIILGGPYFYIPRNLQLPSNIKVIEQTTVEQYYNIDYNPDNWGIEIPHGFDNVGYNFSLVEGHGCYWGECTYCKWGRQQDGFKTLPVKEVHIADHPGDKIISLRSSSMTPSMLNLFPSFPNRDDVFYNGYIRGDATTLQALKSILPKMKTNNIIMSVGVEMPCNEMLSYMGKGTTKETIIETLKLLYDHGIHIHLSFMLGWNNLKYEYINEIKEWFYELEKSIDVKKLSVLLYRLIITKGRPIYNNPPGLLKERHDGLYECILEGEQDFINENIRKLYRKYFGKRLVDFYNQKGEVSTLKRKW